MYENCPIPVNTCVTAYMTVIHCIGGGRGEGKSREGEGRMRGGMKEEEGGLRGRKEKVSDKRFKSPLYFIMLWKKVSAN